jgi:uncharacterized protein YacL
MGRNENDVDRFRRIRDQQLRARDPQTKDRKLQHSIAGKYRRTREPFDLKRVIRDVPHKWKGVIIGALIGLLIFVFLPYVVKVAWVELIGIMAILFCILLGFAIGQAADARDELRDLIKKR